MTSESESPRLFEAIGISLERRVEKNKKLLDLRFGF